MPSPEEARESIKARIKALRTTDRKPPTMELNKVFAQLQKGRNVFLVFDDNSTRLKYQQRILKEACNFLSKEPLGGMPTGAIAGERVYQWDNGSEIAFSTSVPGDPNGNLFYEVKPPNTDIVRPGIPDSWTK